MDWAYKLAYTPRRTETPVVPERRIPSFDERGAGEKLRAFIARDTDPAPNLEGTVQEVPQVSAPGGLDYVASASSTHSYE